jgi:hypothetical protein
MYSQDDLLANRIPFVHSFRVSHQVCDGLRNFYDESPHKSPGVRTYGGGIPVVDETSKKSIDVATNLNNPDLRIASYSAELLSGLDRYKERYPALDNNLDYWGVVERFNIQHYEPGGGFLTWHCERGEIGASGRLLVFMTYLDDVTDGGQTEWEYLGLSVSPEKGLTVIWPSDWMYLHRGVTSPTQSKTIATGWFSFLPNQHGNGA